MMVGFNWIRHAVSGGVARRVLQALVYLVGSKIGSEVATGSVTAMSCLPRDDRCSPGFTSLVGRKIKFVSMLDDSFMWILLCCYALASSCMMV